MPKKAKQRIPPSDDTVTFENEDSTSDDRVTFENPLEDVENPADDRPTHDVKKLKKMNIKKLRAQALNEGLPANSILDAGEDKGKLIDIIMNGPSDEEGLSWAQQATLARGKNDTKVNIDFDEFKSSAPAPKKHFDVKQEVKVVDYWLKDPEENYVPCTNGGTVNCDCIAYALTCPCLWRLACGKSQLPKWDNSDPDPDDMLQMLVFDNVNSGRIYMLAPQPRESLHSVQCRNACAYQKLHHPVLSIFTTHKFNEFSRFEKALVLLLAYVLGCFLTGGLEAATSLSYQDFVSPAALAVFLFLKILTAIASMNPDMLWCGAPVGKAADNFLPLSIRLAVLIFLAGMMYYGVKEERIVILNLCRYSNISEHYGCGKVDTVEEVLPAASLDILKGMVFGAVITCGMSQVYTSQVHLTIRCVRLYPGVTAPASQRLSQLSTLTGVPAGLVLFAKPSIPAEMYTAHKFHQIKNQRGKKEMQSIWKKPYPYGKKKGLVNWMEIQPETQQVVERQRELYIKADKYAKEQDEKKERRLETEVEALMKVEKKDRRLLKQDKETADSMHERDHASAVELHKTALANVERTLEKDKEDSNNIVPKVEAAIKGEIKDVKTKAKQEANEVGPGFFDSFIFFRGAQRKEKKKAAKAIKDAAQEVVKGIEQGRNDRIAEAKAKASRALEEAKSKHKQDTEKAHDRLASQQAEADRMHKSFLERAEADSVARTKSQRNKTEKAEKEAEAAAKELEAKRQREASLDKNKERLREENRTKLTRELEQLLKGESVMDKNIERDKWLDAVIEAGQAHINKKAADTWKSLTPPGELWDSAAYEKLPIAPMHRKLDEAMESLAEAYEALEGAKRHKQVMVDIATPKKMPGRRQKELRKVAKQRIKEAKSDGDDVIAKMNENVLKWKRVAEIGLEKMAMEQDVMITNAEQKLEDLQEAAKATALAIMGFGGRIADIFELKQFQGDKKKEALKGAQILDELIEKDKEAAAAAEAAAKEEEEEEARRLELSKLAKGQGASEGETGQVDEVEVE